MIATNTNLIPLPAWPRNVAALVLASTLFSLGWKASLIAAPLLLVALVANLWLFIHRHATGRNTCGPLAWWKQLWNMIVLSLLCERFAICRCCQGFQERPKRQAARCVN